MLRDVFSGLTLATVTGALYALGMYLGPLSWKLGDGAFDLLVVVERSLSNFLVQPWTGAYARTWPRSTSAIACSRKQPAHERSS
jgi:hypothetical protein